MTKLDKFVAFARELPPEQLESLEDELDGLMHRYASDDAFTPAELVEIERRLAEDHEDADQAAIEALLGRKLP